MNGVKLTRFIFEVCTDVTFVPALAVVANRGRHFELFIGIFQLVASLMFNLCDAIDVDLLFPRVRWHELLNILSITYGCHLLIFLMGNKAEPRDHALRYASFALVWVLQIKDGFWGASHTALVPGALGGLLIAKSTLAPPPFNRKVLLPGAGLLALAGVAFYLSLQDLTDPYRVLHGLNQMLVGWSLQFLWRAVPGNMYKKGDSMLPRTR